MSTLTGKTRVRIDWRGRVLLQVETTRRHVTRQLLRTGSWPPTFHVIDIEEWRDATQADLTHLEPPTIAVRG